MRLRLSRGSPVQRNIITAVHANLIDEYDSLSFSLFPSFCFPNRARGFSRNGNEARYGFSEAVDGYVIKRRGRPSFQEGGRGGGKKERNRCLLAPRNSANASKCRARRRRAFGRNVIFPTVLIARDIISNSRQSASDIPPLSSTASRCALSCKTWRYLRP